MPNRVGIFFIRPEIGFELSNRHPYSIPLVQISCNWSRRKCLNKLWEFQISREICILFHPKRVVQDPLKAGLALLATTFQIASSRPFETTLRNPCVCRRLLEANRGTLSAFAP